ncbi:MAG: CDP-alcohol phosphatidyltransferase family protein [Planctomycetota bacterium]|jgi:CDP-diacylglycerol--serine O-phosphatidyltransferase
MKRGAPTLRRRPSRGTVRHRGRRPLPPVSVVPTIITLGNLVAGFAAIHYASKPLDASGPWGWTSLTVAGALIFAGMFCDAVDGSVARLTRSTSDLGAQLDSLADLVTFGVAPAFMMLRLVSHMLAGDGAGGAIVGPETDSELAKVLWAVAAAYVVATALRLARFNVETPSAAASDHMVFRGLPSPGAAGAIASLILLHQHLLGGPDPIDGDPGPLSKAFAFAIPGVTLACAAGMVSSLPYVHVMNRYVAGGRSFAYVVRIVLPLFPLMLWFQETMAVGFTAYALSAPLRRLRPRWRRGGGRTGHPPDEPAPEAASTPPDGPDTLRP